jgi:putative acetyltransferase
MKFIQAETEADLQSARELFREYEAALGIDLCFQSFEQELAELPGKYEPPDGRLILAIDAARPAGCIALRKIDDTTCEMKRLFVRPAFRGTGLGRQLAERIVLEARDQGYGRMRLDTISGKMDPAIELYRSLGFREIEPYYDSPVTETLFLELVL